MQGNFIPAEHDGAVVLYGEWRRCAQRSFEACRLVPVYSKTLRN